MVHTYLTSLVMIAFNFESHWDALNDDELESVGRWSLVSITEMQKRKIPITNVTDALTNRFFCVADSLGILQICLHW